MVRNSLKELALGVLQKAVLDFGGGELTREVLQRLCSHAEVRHLMQLTLNEGVDGHHRGTVVLAPRHVACAHTASQILHVHVAHTHNAYSTHVAHTHTHTCNTTYTHCHHLQNEQYLLCDL